MLSEVLNFNVKKKADFGKKLVKAGFLAKSELRSLLAKAESEKRHFSEIFFEFSCQPKEKVLAIFSEHFGMPAVDLRKKTISPAVIGLIPPEISQQHNAVIFKKQREIIQVAISNPEDRQVIKFIEKKTGFTAEVHIASPEDIRFALARLSRGAGNEDLQKVIEMNIGQGQSGSAAPEKMAEMVPVIKLVNNLIERALSSRASDIHIQANEKEVIVRYRIDGILHRAAAFPKAILPALTARIKILADIKIDEHMAPQDGRFQYDFNGQATALRVSVIPTLFGPKLALRILEMEEKSLTLQRLGLNKSHLASVKKELGAAHGMILVTGPTGSGKTTTLYTILRLLNKESVNICTIEDPIEYGIDNISQMQIRPRAGVTFASGLRALLRQDPNILMVGEIRDAETAAIAVNSAMTGHLVLSTIHTNSAFLAPQRLIEMGVEPYLFSSVANLLIGQRLVRRLCPHCKTAVRAPEKLISDFAPILDIRASLHKLEKAGLWPVSSLPGNFNIYRRRGCSRCARTGFKGRVGIYEVITVDDDLRRAILADSSEASLKKRLSEKNTLTMTDDGVLKACSGLTTFEEVLRVAKE